LLEAHGRGVRMHVLLYGEAELPVEHVYHHLHADIVTARIGGRMVVATADGAEVAIARFAPVGQIYGILNPPLPQRAASKGQLPDTADIESVEGAL
jgi:hypothetical protein